MYATYAEFAHLLQIRTSRSCMFKRILRATRAQFTQCCEVPNISIAKCACLHCQSPTFIATTNRWRCWTGTLHAARVPGRQCAATAGSLRAGPVQQTPASACQAGKAKPGSQVQQQLRAGELHSGEWAPPRLARHACLLALACFVASLSLQLDAVSPRPAPQRLLGPSPPQSRQHASCSLYTEVGSAPTPSLLMCAYAHCAGDDG